MIDMINLMCIYIYIYFQCSIWIATTFFHVYITIFWSWLLVKSPNSLHFRCPWSQVLAQRAALGPEVYKLLRLTFLWIYMEIPHCCYLIYTCAINFGLESHPQFKFLYMSNVHVIYIFLPSSNRQQSLSTLTELVKIFLLQRMAKSRVGGVRLKQLGHRRVAQWIWVRSWCVKHFSLPFCHDWFRQSHPKTIASALKYDLQ